MSIQQLLLRFGLRRKPHVGEVKILFLRRFGYLEEEWEDVWPRPINGLAWHVQHLHTRLDVKCVHSAPQTPYGYHFLIEGSGTLAEEIERWATNHGINIGP